MTRPASISTRRPLTGRPSHCDGGKTMTPSTVSSTGATRIAPDGSSSSRSMRMTPRSVRAFEASPSPKFTGRSPMRNRMSVPSGDVTRTSAPRIASTKRRCAAASPA